MEKNFTRIEEGIIASINEQAKLLAKNTDILHYDNVTKCYLETLNIQFLALAGKFDVEKAMEVLKKVKEILKKF